MKGARSGVMRVIFALMANCARETLATAVRLVQLDVGRLGHYYPAVLNHFGINCIEVEPIVRELESRPFGSVKLGSYALRKVFGIEIQSGALWPKKAAR